MAEVAIKKGFVCPECRLIVAAPSLASDYIAKCPGCSVDLSIPNKFNLVSAIDVSPESLPSMTIAVPNQSVPQHNLKDSWQEDLPIELLAERSKGLPWYMLAPAGVLGLTLLVSLLYLLNVTEVPTSEGSATYSEEEKRGFDGKSVERIEKVEVTRDFISNYLENLSQAKTTEELVPLVRQVDNIKNKIESYYTNSKEPFFEFDDSFDFGRDFSQDSLYLLNIQLPPAGEKIVALSQRKDGQLELDWESYVGYCEIPWGLLKSKKPKKGVLVRAVRRKIEYYNLGFGSDEWQSFELSYPNSNEILIGYVKRDSSLIHQLLPIGSSDKKMEVTLKIRYPEGIEDNRIVIIDSLVAANWFTPDKK